MNKKISLLLISLFAFFGTVLFSHAQYYPYTSNCATMQGYPYTNYNYSNNCYQQNNYNNTSYTYTEGCYTYQYNPYTNTTTIISNQCVSTSPVYSYQYVAPVTYTYTIPPTTTYQNYYQSYTNYPYYNTSYYSNNYSTYQPQYYTNYNNQNQCYIIYGYLVCN